MPRKLENIRRAAFNITAGFEGTGYAAYQTYDKGIVSYGRFQFTLASGSLFTVLERYLAKAGTETAAALRDHYLQRVQARDEGLRQDADFKRLLLAAATDPAMEAVQDAVATEKYWDVVQALSIQPRNIQTPLGQALIFDMGINHGPRHDMLGLAEKALGAPPRSRLPENGLQEPDLIRQVALVRQERLHRLADKLNLGGLRTRGDFWVRLAEIGDFGLIGDEHGLVEVLPGRWVSVFFAEDALP